MPQQGVNALEVGFAFLLAAKGVVEGLFAANEFLGGNTFSITGSTAGVKINVLPDGADFMVDVRFVPAAADAAEQISAAIGSLSRQWEAESPVLKISWNVRDGRSALASNPAVRHLLDLCAAQSIGILYFTDASLAIPRRPDQPFAILGPGNPAQCHTPNESVQIEEILQAAELYRRYIEAFP